MTHDHDPAGAEALDALARDYWEAVLEEEPLFATQIGDHRYDDRLRDPSPAGRATWRARLEALVAREAALDEARLDPDARVTRSALREALRSDLAHLRTGIGDWTVDPLEGPQVEFENVEAYHPVTTPADGAARVAPATAPGVSSCGPCAQRSPGKLPVVTRCAYAYVSTFAPATTSAGVSASDVPR